ncbi:hypothetical protein LL240_06485 [Oceanimonas baumannii]|uniref:hypothetical protein n=1 Tax=Oceanimonas baumannii TaxID=129578 RepID=UPI001D18E2BB|nr:hypothetical protein [Oceanimonas baumannii]MCC4264103.1 hypothetical protein [Oceanimonas baumannii]
MPRTGPKEYQTSAVGNNCAWQKLRTPQVVVLPVGWLTTAILEGIILMPNVVNNKPSSGSVICTIQTECNDSVNIKEYGKDDV